MFSVRLVCADSYQAQPVPQLDPTFSEFRGSEIKHVPVIRIFGATAEGEKTCLHVHGVFPYLFIPYTGEEDPEILAYRLAAALDAAINVSLGSATSSTQHVYSVQRVSGIPFYGYHRKEHQFFKIYFYNPAMIKRAAELLQNGSVLNQSLQPHEAHINYILQFMMDYNIYGMSLVNLRSCKHRRATQSLAELSSSGQSINSESSDIVYLPIEIERQSTCELEVDAVASDILNRLEIENDLELNPGLAAIWEEERARRAQAGFSGGDSQLVNPKSPTRPPFEPTDNDVYQEQRLARRLLMISQCDESTLSTTSHRSMAYAAETRDNENLMNASRLPNVSVQRTERLHQGGQDELGNMTLDSAINPASQNFTPDSSILGAEDMSLVDLLAQLARETDNNPETVDADSLLGSQVSSVVFNENETENKSDNEEEEEDGAADLNLTCLELESLGSIEAAVNQVGKSSLLDNTPSEKKNKASSILDESPFLSPCEISSCSVKSAMDEETVENEDSRSTRMPQYDGAGDVSPTLLNSDHEDSREIPNNAKDYERLPEYNDFADMRSSMEIGILLSSGDDNEKAESLGESNQDEDDENDDDDGNNNNSNNNNNNDDEGDDEDDDDSQDIPLESVLNGDPCFTESAELDKSDLAELHDQYVSLLDNALLPEVRDSSRIDSDDLEDSSSTFAVEHFETIEKTCPVSPEMTSRAALVTSRDSSSSLENIAPNVPRTSTIATDHEDSRRRKETQVSTTNDSADYNCNVVATWEELQNLRIIDKSENDRATNPSRHRPRSGKYVPGPRSKRRVRRSSSLERATGGHVVGESAEKIEQLVAQSCLPSETFRERTSEIYDMPDETLSRVLDVTKFSESPNENTRIGDYPAVQRTNGLEAFNRSFIMTDNSLADVRSTLPGARYSAYPSLHANDSLVEPILADFEEIPDNLCEYQAETLSDVGVESFTSYYVPRRSLSSSDTEDRQHRHCFLSKHNKIVHDHAFASDQLWIIQRRKRGSINSNLRNICTSQDCKLPIVFVRKLEESQHERPIVEKNAISSIDEITEGQAECTLSATEKSAPSIIPSSEKSFVESAQSAVPRRTRSKRELPSTRLETTIRPTEKIDTATRSIEPHSSKTRCAHRRRDVIRTKPGPYNTRRRLHGSQFVKQRRRNVRIDVESGEKSRSGRKKARARTKYKEGKLPGIPGILNHETTDKRRRSRKIVLSSNSRDDIDSSRTRKSSSPKVLTNSSARGDQTLYAPNGVVKKSPAYGFVTTSRNIDVPLGKLRGRCTKASLSMNPLTKKRASSHDIGQDPSRLADLPRTAEKFTDTCQSHSTKIRSNSILTCQKKFPETVTLGLMLQEARSPGTRRALQLLLQKRLNEKLECEKIKNEPAGKKSKTNETKVADDCDGAKKETIVQRVSEVTTDQMEVAKSSKIQLDDGTENSMISKAPSFESVTNSDANSKNQSDSISIVSLDSEICKPVEFDRGPTTLGAEFSVDDAAIVIFDSDTAADSVIVEATNAQEFTNVVKITYDTDRYENAIKEANFFAGRNYSIDAVSNEIPTCLFEEDSNSIDKRLPKRTSDVSADDPDARSELSVDLRDLDVYDVESLTSTGSVSALDETIDVTETSLEIFDEDSSVIEEDTGIRSPDENSRGQEDSTNVANFEDTIPEHESSFEEDSPSFEALSPEPRVILTLAPALEEEFAVHSQLEFTDVNQDESALPKIHDETLVTSEHFSVPIDEEKSSIKMDFSEDNDASSENRSGTANKEFSRTIENSEIVAFPNSSIGADTSGGAIQSDQINENELEIPEVLETRGQTESPVDTEIQKNFHVSKYDALEEKASSSTEENPVLTSSTRKIDASEIVEANAKSSADEMYEENDSSPIAEEVDKLSTTIEVTLNRIFIENEKHSSVNSQDLAEALPEESEFSSCTERQTNEATPVEQEKQLPETTEEGAEVPVSAEKEILISAQSSMTAREDVEISEPSASELELSASHEADEQFSSAMEEESTLQITDDEQRGVTAHSPMDDESSAIVHRDEKLLESNKSHLAEPVYLEKEIFCSSVESNETCKETMHLPLIVEEQSTTRVSAVEDKDEFTPRARLNIKGPMVVQLDERKSNISEKEFDAPKPKPEDESSSVTSTEKTALPISNENQKLSSTNKDVAGSQVAAKRTEEEKAEVARQFANEEEIIVEGAEKVAQQFVDEEKMIVDGAEKVAQQFVDEEKMIVEGAEKVAQQFVDEEKMIVEGAEKVAQQFVDEEKMIVEGAEKVAQQFVDEEKTIKEEAEKLDIEEQFLSQRLETEEAQSKVKNEETGKKNPTNEIVSGEEEILDNRNELIDVNKNDRKSTNASPNSAAPDENRACKDEPKARLECRPVSIKLVNIDLSKIRSFAPETCYKPGNDKAEEEMSTETSKISPNNCNDETSVVKIIGPIVEKLKKSVTTDSHVSRCNDKVRRRRRRIPKDTRMPERRSVRICAEMTLKLSQQQSPKKSTQSMVECSRRESESSASMQDSLVSGSSLAPNFVRIFKKDGSVSGEMKKIGGHFKLARTPSTIRASMDGDSREINEDPTTKVGASPTQEFMVCQSKTNVSQELVLSEQTMANGNAAASSIKAPKRGRFTKRVQSQEVPSSLRIIDENTAPTSDNSKDNTNATRKKSQVNLQEALVDIESSKLLISEETSRRNVDKTSIAKDRNADLKNLSIRRRRGRPVGCYQIRRRTRVRVSSVSAKSNRDDLESSRDFEKSPITRRRDLGSSLTLALPLLDTKNIPNVGKTDEASLPEESAREVKTELRINARRGRSEKKIDVDKAASECDSSTGKNSHSNAEVLSTVELTLEKNHEEYVDPLANRRRGRSGKIPEILTSPSTIRRSVEIPLQRFEALPERSEDSNEPKTSIVLKRRARHAASPETRLDSRQTELSLQRSTDTEAGTSENPKKRGRPRKYPKTTIDASEETSEFIPTEKTSQEPEKMLEKIVESSLLVTDTPDHSNPLSPRLSLTESQKSSLEPRIVPEETISLPPDRENSCSDSSSMQKNADTNREGTTKSVLSEKCKSFYRWRRKGRRSRKPRPFSKPFLQGGSNETTSRLKKEYSESEKTDQVTEPKTQPDSAELARKKDKSLEESPFTLTNASPMDGPVTKLQPEKFATPKKRVHFDEESIARSAMDCQDSSQQIFEHCPKKLYKQKEVHLPGSVGNIVQGTCEKSTDDSSGDEDDAKPIDAEESDGTRYSRRNGLFLELSSCSTGAKAQLPGKRFRGILKKHEYAVHVDDKLRFSRIKFGKSLEPLFQLRNLRSTHSSQCSPRETIAYTQLKRPIILLKRLSRKSLKSYGIAYRPRDRTFVKETSIHRYSTEDDEDEDEEFKLPAYDGAADLSSSDEEDPDVTIASEEKRICSYRSSAKKVPLALLDDSAVTPKKRKLEVTGEEATSPAKKHPVYGTQPCNNNRNNNVTPRKKSYCSSPGGTSTLKTPGGGNARIYSPLKIIVTSPKVRKETLETKSSPRRTEKHEGNANNNPSTSSFIDSIATTSARKNSRLHDTVLRGRFLNTALSSLRELGDKHVTVDKTGSSAVGELDEIRSIGQTEQWTVNKLHTSTASVYHESSSRLRDSASSSTILPDGKDVRKRLLFSDNETNHENEKIIDSLITEVHETLEMKTSRKDIERLGGIEDDEESIEVTKSPKHREAIMFEAVAGSSRYCDNSERICEERSKVQTDEDADEDDVDVCNVTFTQYIESQESKKKISFSADHETNEMKKRITIMPKFKPPSRQRIVDTMEKYGIAKYRNVEPFFSVAADVPKPKESAHRMLKVPGKSLDLLPAFVPSVEGVTGLARWRKMWLNEFRPSLVKSTKHAIRLALASSSERIVVTPLAKPPTRKQVMDWLRAREYLTRMRNTDVEESKKELKQPDVEETKRTSKKSDVEETRMELKQSELLEVRAVENHRDDDDESDSSDVSVVEPSPERTLVSKDLEKMARSVTSAKFAKRTLFKIKPADCKSSEKNGPRSRESTSNVRDKITPDSIELADPSLLDVLEKSRLFRDQEGSRRLGFSRGQIEFLSDSTRSNITAENLRNVKALTRYQYLTIMCLEVHVVTRGDLLPDAQYDPIAAIFYSVQSDVPPTSRIKPLEHGVIVLAEDEKSKNKMYYTYASVIPWTVNFASNEEALLNSLVTLITRVDPEILIGWELETLSWGYVFQRASRLGMNLFNRVSRIPATQYKWEFQAPDIETLAEVKLPGRIVLDIWRLMRHEAALLSYTFESVMHHVLNERIPCPPYSTLTEWWNLARARPCRWRVVEHYSTRVIGIFRILDQLDIIGRTSELARLFGIQFYEVFSRGSQFRVESVMLRLAKPLNYIAVSPSSQQRASMRAMEALPLIMEPESMFYSDPLIVLDFQSLYPSIIIAHNYCFSTCLGRIEHIGQPEPFEFGAYTLRVPKRTALKLQGKVNYAPCGVAYVKPEVRLGILPRMLTEILETRFMVKKAMKDHNKEDKTLQRALHSRQMGLKFLANVTYGYTAANFSGRMPCIEVGDSVISKSKETLERAIKLVELTPKWGARVVYGDTDSLFILVPGKSKDEAFVIGNEIADAVTASNPPPIKLKFEKILYPAILQTKKRYCGYMYETPDQANPTYLAKGIETVRRDGCPAVSKILEKTLKILFETKDVSLVKKYVTRQLDKVLRGKVSIQDLTFAKEFRGLKGYKTKACVPALELTRRLMKKDPRAVPRTSERVRYVIVAGAPNQALIHCVRTPWELMNDPGLRPNAIYYVTRVIIPPLNRCLNLMGVGVNEWYREMPHRQILDNPVGQPSDKQKLTIFQYFGTIVCVACGQPSNKGICVKCLGRPADTLVVINEKLRWLDRSNNHVTAICQSCVGQADAADCASLDCPVLYRRAQARRELTQASHLREIIERGNNLEF